MWGSFGDIVFKLLQTPQTIEITEKAKYASVELYGQKEKLHFTGLEGKTVNLTFTLNAAFCNPSEELQKLRQLKQKAKAQNLIIGDENLGQFVITDLKTNITKTTPTGQIINANLEITLKEV